MKYYIICDYREIFKNYAMQSETITYNDHPAEKNIKEIMDSISQLGHDCEYYGGIPQLIHAIDHNCCYEDCIFLNFTDGMSQNYSRVQAPALLEILNVPFSGSGVFPSALMNNKHFCKKALSGKGINIPRSCIVNENIPFEPGEISTWGFPVFVKPNCEGSSLGISNKSVCHTQNDVIFCIEELLKEFEEIIIEEYVSGTDITNYLIGNGDYYWVNDVVSIELFDKSLYSIFGAEEKRLKKRTLSYNNEKLPSQIVELIQKTSVEIAQTIGVHDMCRIDYRYDEGTKKLSFIEINSAPRFSNTSEIGFIAEKRNLSFTQMVELYLQCVNERLL